MSFFWIKKAALTGNYDPEYAERWRRSFELSGVTVVQMALASGGTVLFDGMLMKLTDPWALWAALWLEEQHERATRREALSMAMEATIMVLVAVELYYSWLGHHAAKAVG